MFSENLVDRDNQQIIVLPVGNSDGILMGLQTTHERYPVISETEKAWLAGFLDADGMIRLRLGQKNKVGPKSLVPIVTYTNTCAYTTKRVCELVGASFTDFSVGVREETNKKNGVSWSTKLTIEIGGVIRVQPFLKMLHPYMVTKAAEAALMLRFCEIRVARNRQSYGAEEYRISEGLKFLKRARHLRDYTPSVEQVLNDDIVRTAAEAVEVAEMTTRMPIEARKEWARNLVSTYRWNKACHEK